MSSVQLYLNNNILKEKANSTIGKYTTLHSNKSAVDFSRNTVKCAFMLTLLTINY